MYSTEKGLNWVKFWCRYLIEPSFSRSLEILQDRRDILEL
jgi:hypothetical protein